MIVVADGGPLHYLILLDQIELLHRFYGQVVIPDAVANELRAAGSPATVRLALDFAGPDRILAGSDYPHQIGSIPLMIETIRGLDVGDEVKRKIFGAHAAARLGLA